jgi:hypothetical protein
MGKVTWYITKSGELSQGPYVGTIIGCYYDNDNKCPMLLIAEENSGVIHKVDPAIATFHTV